MYLIDGKKIAAEIKEEVRTRAALLAKEKREAALAVIQVGEDPASCVYVRNKKKACADTGIRSLSFDLPQSVSEEELLALIGRLNSDDSVDGILVQLPLPKHIDEQKVILAISADKDVDGFHPENVGRLWSGQDGFVSCTPAGVIQLLKRSGIVIEGADCVIVGRSNIVGKPMAALMLREGATVTVAHSKTKNLKAAAARADILIVCAGVLSLITEDMVKEQAVVIDVGIHRKEDGRLCGDVDFEHVADKCRAITPVPGGVGPMTIAMLMENCVRSAWKRLYGNTELWNNLLQEQEED